jgi:hypothetical protein
VEKEFLITYFLIYLAGKYSGVREKVVKSK